MSWDGKLAVEHVHNWVLKHPDITAQYEREEDKIVGKVLTCANQPCQVHMIFPFDRRIVPVEAIIL